MPATGCLLAGWLTGAMLTGAMLTVGCAPQAPPGGPPPGQVAVRSGTDMTAARRRLDDPLRDTDPPPAPGDPWYGTWQQQSRDGASAGGTGACTAENRPTDAPLPPGDVPPPPCPPLAHADHAAAGSTLQPLKTADRAGENADPTTAPASGRESDSPGTGMADAPPGTYADIFLRAPAPPVPSAPVAGPAAVPPPLPTRDAPTRDAPTRDAPTRDAPTRDAPTRDAPTRDAPDRDAPDRDASSPALALPPGGAPGHQAASAAAAGSPASAPAGDPDATGTAGAVDLARAVPDSLAPPGAGTLPGTLPGDGPAAGLPMAGKRRPAGSRSDADDLLAGVPLPDLDLALAYPDGEAGAPAAGDGAQLILDLTTRVVGIVDNPSLAPGDRRAALRRLLTDRVDVRGLARFAAGRHWRAALPSVREDYERLFSELMVLIYGNRLRTVADYDLKVIDAFSETLGRETVEMVARDEDGEAIEINWRLRSLGGDLRIEDIDLGGVSFRSTQRDELRAVFDDGGDLRGAVVLLRRKVADLRKLDDSR